MSNIIRSNSTIYVAPTEGERIKIEWKQSYGGREEYYYSMPWICDDIGTVVGGVIFVQQSYFYLIADSPSLDLNTAEKYFLKPDRCRAVQLDNQFQIGINNKKDKMFLVLHDKTNKPYQHRFVQTTFLSQIDKMIRFEVKVPYLGAVGFNSFAKAVIGDYLRDLNEVLA